MYIESDRFGQITVENPDLFTFESPIFGFPSLSQYCLYECPEDNTFVWLQSVEDATVAFPLIEPEILFDPYEIKIHTSDLIRVGSTSDQDAKLRRFVIVSMSNDPKAVSANFRAPILLNLGTRKGTQIILDQPDYGVDIAIFDALRFAFRTNFFKRRDLTCETTIKKRVFKTFKPTVTTPVFKKRPTELDIN